MLKPLTRAEEEVMQVLWKIGHGFLKDIRENSLEPRPHPNTTATLLKILINKGFVRFETRGRNNLYHPRITRADYGKRKLNQVLNRYFEGSPTKMVNLFMAENKISVEDLEEIIQQKKLLKKNHPS
jgi:BlaI family transcriptional regulator, penicillinase repressor